jgi:hypothetical protein
MTWLIAPLVMFALGLVYMTSFGVFVSVTSAAVRQQAASYSPITPSITGLDNNSYIKLSPKTTR